jgi:oxygen-independent coproporphyrinogen-3 oxidase
MAGLYLHIPFCGSRCAYCDFYSTTRPGLMPGFLEALGREMTARRDFFSDGRLDTVYVGGGTPSLLRPEQLRGLLGRAAGLWDCSSLGEATLEANPEDLTGDYLAGLREENFPPAIEGWQPKADGAVFNRLSIGIQSFDDGLLKMMNRRHDAGRARQAVMAARQNGFDNISIDLIYGIPGMTQRQWERTLDEAVALGVQHISAYHLTIEPGTAFGRMARRDRKSTSPSAFRPVPEAESERQFETLRERLAQAGFDHYEISNFALPGRRAIHNSAYWSGAPYLGVGPSAHSFDGVRRREWVTADLEKYISGAGTDAIYEGETLSDTELRNERIMTGLRTSGGIMEDQSSITNHQSGIVVSGFLRDGLLVRRGDRIAIPPEKWLLSDHIIASLFE